MLNIIINKKPLQVKEGTSILNAAMQAGIRIPTLCYFKDLNEVGACRICVVEVKGEPRLMAACNTPCADGMEIETDSARVLAARRSNLALILANHDCKCPSCPRNENCELQSLAREFNMTLTPYEEDVTPNRWDNELPLIRNNSKCIQCYRCVSVCDKLQSMNVWELLGSGKRAHIGVRGGKDFSEVACTYCGQCITHCPVGALTERDDTQKVLRALADPAKKVVVQVAPAVRSAWAADLGLSAELATEKRMAAAFKATGADYVFDTNFTADLTIMEEGRELLYKLQHKADYNWPMFTSCCPGWVRFLKMEYPEYVPQLSSAKSPQQMFGAVIKSYFAKISDIAPEDIFSVSVMPCTAKKYEASLNDDVDVVLTTREAAKLVRMLGIDVAALPDGEFDSPLGTGSGAGVIFGSSGGVMEAALRTAAYILEGKNPDADAFKAVRSNARGRREFTLTLGGNTIHACVASGLANARSVMEDIKCGRAQYDFVEIMACPGGCAGGGGQPIVAGEEPAEERGAVLYALDAANCLRFSHENPDVQTLYKDFLGEPLSHVSHEFLHTDQTKWPL